MKDGKKNGLYTDYYPSKIMDGKIVRKQVVNFKNDLEEGMYTQYSDGLKHAEWKMYEIEYKNGLKHGLYKKYGAFINCSMFNNGEPFVQVEDNYKNGKKHGLCTLYLNSQPGVIANQEEYKDGEKTSASGMHEASIIPGTPTKSKAKPKGKNKGSKGLDFTIYPSDSAQELLKKLKSLDKKNRKISFISIKVYAGTSLDIMGEFPELCELIKEELPEFYKEILDEGLIEENDPDEEGWRQFIPFYILMFIFLAILLFLILNGVLSVVGAVITLCLVVALIYFVAQ